MFVLGVPMSVPMEISGVPIQVVGVLLGVPMVTVGVPMLLAGVFPSREECSYGCSLLVCDAARGVPMAISGAPC